MKRLTLWIKAFRLRTLPLSLSSIFLGSFLAFRDGSFSWPVFLLAALTTLFLQILSNLANDYGDSQNGMDNQYRIGPKRTVQSGEIKARSMRIMVLLFVLLSLASGGTLVIIGTNSTGSLSTVLYFLMGFASIGAAIKYTVGKNPYGYQGLGDLFVFIFFGLIGVAATYFLHTNHFPPDILLPASSVGLLSAGVLNLNNMRDRISDERSGKRTLAVILGGKHVKVYHIVLLSLSILTGLIYTILHFKTLYQFSFLATLPLLFKNIREVMLNTIPADLDPELKKLALTTLIFAITFGLGSIL